MPRGSKHHNEYAAVLGRVFSNTPKAVLAAIAVSFASCGGDRLDEAADAIVAEWRALFESGVVPQDPDKYLKK